MLLEVEGVLQKFGGLVAVDHASFSVARGQIFGLIGPNGAGKTTLLNVIAGVYHPTEGHVRFRGKDINGLAPEDVCHKGISRTFQVPRKFGKMTALENVIVASTFGASTRGRVDPRALAEEALDTVRWTLPKDVIARTLNAAQLKRLDLARALASKPELLLLDEPASGLNRGEVGDLMDLIRDIRSRGITIIVVEHLMQMIMAIVDSMVVLNYGKTIARGTPEEIRNNRDVIEAYLGDDYLG